MLSNLRTASNFSDHPRWSAAGSSSCQGTMVDWSHPHVGGKPANDGQVPQDYLVQAHLGGQTDLAFRVFFYAPRRQSTWNINESPARVRAPAPFPPVSDETKSSRNSRCANRAATHLHRRCWLWAPTAADFDLSGKSAVRSAAQNPETGKLASPSLTLTRLRPRNRHNWSGNPREILKTQSWPFQRDFAYPSPIRHRGDTMLILTQGQSDFHRGNGRKTFIKAGFLSVHLCILCF